MSTPARDFEGVLLARFEALEARNRRLTRALAALSVLLGGLAVLNGLFTWYVWTRPTVEAQEFVVRASDGVVRARMGHRDSGTGIQSTTLKFLDAAGRARVQLVADDPCYLQMSNSDGEGYVSLNAGKNQCDLAMYFQKENNKPTLFLNLHRAWGRVALDAGGGRSWKQEVGGPEK
jgi:hypothetical protein